MSLSGNKRKIQQGSIDTSEIEKKKESTPRHYHEISRNADCANSEYKQLTEQMLMEQAARVFQRSWRKKKGKKFTGKYEETLTRSLSMRFFREPIGPKYEEHAKLINSGCWTALKFDHPEFLDDLYKAVRLDLLRIDRMATAEMLLDARVAFHDKEEKIEAIKQIPCNDDGSCGDLWSPAKVSYVTKKIILDLKQRIKKLDPADRQYFIINFPRKYEGAFLFEWLKNVSTAGEIDHGAFRKIMVHFIKYRLSWNISAKVDELLRTLKFNNIENVPSEPSALLKFLLQAVEETKNAKPSNNTILILKICIAVSDVKLYPWISKAVHPSSDVRTLKDRDKDRESIALLAHYLARFYEQGPGCCLSPDFNDQDSNSPLIGLILPTAALYKELLKSFFGEEQATMPHFTVGPVTTRMIRKCDDIDQSRPVELAHPDVRSPELLEDLFVHRFIRTWHDFIFHLIRNSINEHKKLYREIKNLFISVKGFDMSKMIWKYSDLDKETYKLAETIKEALSRCDMETVEILRAAMFMSNMEIVVENFWAANTHNAYIVIVDMIINSKKWEEVLGHDPEKYISQAMLLFKKVPENFGFHNATFNGAVFQEAYKRIKTIITDFPNHSIEFYILVIQLGGKGLNAKKLAILEFIDNNKLIFNVLRWDRNKGLHFRSNVIDVADKFLENLEPDLLFSRLISALSNYANNHSLDNLKTVLSSYTAKTMISVSRIFSQGTGKFPEKFIAPESDDKSQIYSSHNTCHYPF